MKRIRGFEIAKGFENNGINLPERKTNETYISKNRYKSIYAR